MAVTPVKAPLTAYNLTVADFETFFVAANDNAEPVWVHNCSGRLGRNLDASTLPNSTRLPGYQAHHINAANHLLNDRLRGRFEGWGIGLDEAANGIFLPGSVNTINLDGSTVHPRNNAYYNWVTDQFANVADGDCLGARRVLNNIRDTLGAGRTPWQ